MSTKEEIDDFLEEIDALREDDRYKFADTTLSGIRKTVEDTKQISARQRQAIKNIRESRDGTRDEKNWNRRYEGHSSSKEKM